MCSILKSWQGTWMEEYVIKSHKRGAGLLHKSTGKDDGWPQTAVYVALRWQSQRIVWAQMRWVLQAEAVNFGRDVHTVRVMLLKRHSSFTSCSREQEEGSGRTHTPISVTGLSLYVLLTWPGTSLHSVWTLVMQKGRRQVDGFHVAQTY